MFKIASLVVVSIALFVCGILADRLVDVQGHIQAPCRERSSRARPGMPNEKECVNYKDALEVLRAEQTSWLTILGIFCGIFGFLVPAGSYLLQRQSLVDERKSIEEDMRELKNRFVTIAEQEKKLETLDGDLRRLQKSFDGQNQPFWRSLARCFEWMVINSKTTRDGVRQRKEEDVANVLLAAELMMDAVVVARDKNGLKRRIVQLKLVVEIMRHTCSDQEWDNAIGMILHSSERTSLVSGISYLDLIESSDPDYQWLKGFFDTFAPGKLA